jgi:imidazolonepropionase-like amidohydrolase
MKTSLSKKGITYRGERFSGYNKPKSTPGKSKKSAVLAKEDGKVALVRYGDPNMTIKKHIPANRKSFRARMNCDNPGSKLSARFWSCRAW